ncbi:hypothetical protein HW132_32165 [Brasilonema sp. CT11]|nr:hypothetical protein [Brasilonema sp. CT11]
MLRLYNVTDFILILFKLLINSLLKLLYAVLSLLSSPMNHSSASPTDKAAKWLAVLREQIAGIDRKAWLPKVIGSYRQQPADAALEIIYACLREGGLSLEFIPEDNLVLAHKELLFYLVEVRQYTELLNPDDLAAFGGKVTRYAEETSTPALRGLFVHSGKVRGVKNIPLFAHVSVISGNKLVDLILTPQRAVDALLDA